MSLTLTDARARAALLTVLEYRVHLDLTDAASFGSTTTVRFTAAAPASTFVDIAGATELSATLDDRPLDVAGYDGHRLPLTDLAGGAGPTSGVGSSDGEVHELMVAARLPYDTGGEGMHAFTDPADGERYVSAYCGMDLAHRVFACFDQPDLKAPLTLSVDAPAAWTVLGNGIGSSSTRSPGVRRWELATTPPISTYLFVVCAGPWASVRFEHAGLPFGWHARASLRDQLDRDGPELIRITRACFDHYTGTFAPPYPFDSYDQVLVPGLNWGAMETPGCVTFREEYLPRARPTGDERLNRAMVIAHEMAHMWFGDLTTMRWWEDSWLNESFADYMGYEVAGRAAGFEGAWTGAALVRKPTAYVADARRSTHPVAEDTAAMVDVDTAFGNFDMITYAKGAAVVRQLVTWLGEAEFLAGVNAYLSEHAFGNADLRDFLAALDGATDRDVRGWAEAWLRSTGFDTIGVDYDAGGVPVLRRDGFRPHRMRVGGYDAAGNLVVARTVEVGEQPHPLPDFAGLAVLPNDRDETYARLDLPDADWSRLSGALSTIESGLTRGLLWATAVDRVITGRLTVRGLVELAGEQLADEPDPVVLESALDLILRRVLRLYAAPADVVPAQRRIAALCRGVLACDRPELAIRRAKTAESTSHGPSAGPGADRGAAVLRTLATTSTDAEELGGWLRDGRTATGQPVDPDLRWVALVRLAGLDAVGAERIEAELTRDTALTARLGALRARAARPDAEAKAAAWTLMHADGVSNREYKALAAGLWTPGQADLLEPWLERYAGATLDLARRRGPGFAGSVLGRSFPLLPLPLPALRALRDSLATALDADPPTTLRRSWEDRLDDLDVMLRVRSGSPPRP